MLQHGGYSTPTACAGKAQGVNFRLMASSERVTGRGWLLAIALTIVAPDAARALAQPPATPLIVRPGRAPATLIVRASDRVIIPAGRFQMGASAEELEQARTMCADELRSGGALRLELSPRCQGRFEGEAPAAPVYLRRFAIDRLEVTVAQHGACVRAGSCRSIPGVTAMESSTAPIERASFDDAQDYCRWRGGRLPSEAEWEKAARGSGGRSWPWGADWRDRRANHGRAELLGPAAGRPGDGDSDGDATVDDQDGHAAAAPVGSFPAGASPYGVLDLAGNVWEWTSGHFSREPPQGRGRFQPLGATAGSERTVRGGSYRSPPSDLRVTRRLGLHPSERLPGVGFRCAYDVNDRNAAPRAM
jgi:sulfatase modifying factor 1